MTSAVYLVEVDFDKDAAYAHALSNISGYVLNMTWNNGMTNPEQEFANPAQLSLTLDNSHGDFNLEDSSATFYGLFKQGLLVRVRAVFSSTTYTLFIGKLTAQAPLTMDNYGELTYTLTARDLMEELLDVEFAPELETDVTTDTALRQPFAQGVVALPYASSFWILGVSTLGVDTVLLGEAAMVDFDTGNTTLAYAGDTVGGNTTVRAQQFLREITAAECGGRFFFNSRTGKFTFHNRHHDTNPTSAATLNADDYDEASYTPQSPVVNKATIHYQPREVGAAGSVIYSNPNPILLAGRESKSLTVRYKDATVEDARIGAMDFVTPQPGVDYIANVEQDGSGAVATHLVVVSVDFGATSATITLTNARPRRTYVTTLQLRGTPLRSFARDSVSSAPDGDSVYAYDPHSVTITLPAVDDEELAQQYADSLVARKRTPHAVLTAVTFTANAHSDRMTQALTRDIGDVVTVANSDFDHSRMYAIVGERHSVQPGGEHPHNVTWTLKPVDAINYWVLGVTGMSELGSTTILAF